MCMEVSGDVVGIDDLTGQYCDDYTRLTLPSYYLSNWTALAFVRHKQADVNVSEQCRGYQG